MKKRTYKVLMWIFTGLFLFSVGALVWYGLDTKVQSENYSALAQIAQQARPSLPQMDAADTTDSSQLQIHWITINDPETGEPVQLLPEFAQLYTMNNDLVGWIRIPGTNIDYPMMQTPDSPDYYLRRDFEKKKNTHGCIYVKENCDLSFSDNVTIYGHRMRNGTMFGALGKFKDKSFWQENKTVLLDTLTQRRAYEIFAVFLTTASVGQGFSYHTFVQADSSEQYDDFVAQCKELSIYDTGITPQYGQQLITLSTCDSAFTNGRLVVVARLVDE